MDKPYKDKVRSRYTGKEFKFKQKLLTFLFFLALSSIFWLLNKLENNYSANITYPIKYIYHKPDKELVGDVPSELNLNLSAQGYALLRSMITARQHPIVFRLISLNFNEITGDTNRYFVLTRNLKEVIQRQIGSEITLNYISPDTLFYNFSTIVRKKVVIVPNIDLEFEKQYMPGAGGTISQPDSIVISGPRSLIDTINKVYTVYKKFTKVDKSISEEFKLQPIEGVYFVKNKAILSIPVDKYTETFLMVPVKINNLPDSMQMKTFPSAIRVSFIVALRNYNKVTPYQFKAVVDYKNVYTSINNRLKVNLERQPAYVKFVSYRPMNVDFIIEK